MISSQQGSSANLDDRVAYMRDLQKEATETHRRAFDDRFLMSWIYHDNALEGVVYTPEELRAGVSDAVVSDAALLPTYDEIRAHKAAIDVVKELAQKKRVPVNLDAIKKVYVTLAPDEIEGKGQPKYRKDMPVHRLYFHDIAPPDKIQGKLKQLVDWMNDPETKRSTHPVRLAAKAHYQFLSAYPFAKQSGKMGRLLMNLILLRHDYPPVVIHATERQRYYDALKGTDNQAAQLVNEAMVASVESTIHYYEELLGVIP